jgi:hypothetical protein
MRRRPVPTVYETEGDRATTRVLLSDGLAGSSDRTQPRAGLTFLRRESRVVPAAGWHVAVRPTVTTSATGRQRELAPWRCPWCPDAWHLAVLVVPLPDRVVRRAPCTGKRITIHVPQDVIA